MEVPDDSKGERLAHQMRLLQAASAGILDALECPSCHKDSVSVWFTHPGGRHIPNVVYLWRVLVPAARAELGTSNALLGRQSL